CGQERQAAAELECDFAGAFAVADLLVQAEPAANHGDRFWANDVDAGSGDDYRSATDDRGDGVGADGCAGSAVAVSGRAAGKRGRAKDTKRGGLDAAVCVGGA